MHISVGYSIEEGGSYLSFLQHSKVLRVPRAMLSQ